MKIKEIEIEISAEELKASNTLSDNIYIMLRNAFGDIGNFARVDEGEVENDSK